MTFLVLFMRIETGAWADPAEVSKIPKEIKGTSVQIKRILERAEQEAPGSKAVQDVLNRISKYCSTRVEYQFGNETEVLDGNRIVGWIRYDPVTSTIYLDREELTGYIGELAEKYDTYQKPREFQTSNGDWVTVSGGNYG